MLADDELEVIVNAVADVMRGQLAKLTPGVRDVTLQPVLNLDKLQPPQVRVENVVNPTPIRNEVPPSAVVVNVDLSPVAEAIGAAIVRMTEALTDQTEILRQLVSGLAESPAPVFSPQVTLPERSITVEAPQVTVEAPERKRITLQITHDDGSKSFVKEVA